MNKYFDEQSYEMDLKKFIDKHNDIIPKWKINIQQREREGPSSCRDILYIYNLTSKWKDTIFFFFLEMSTATQHMYIDTGKKV